MSSASHFRVIFFCVEKISVPDGEMFALGGMLAGNNNNKKNYIYFTVTICINITNCSISPVFKTDAIWTVIGPNLHYLTESWTQLSKTVFNKSQSD